MKINFLFITLFLFENTISSDQNLTPSTEASPETQPLTLKIGHRLFELNEEIIRNIDSAITLEYQICGLVQQLIYSELFDEYDLTECFSLHESLEIEYLQIKIFFQSFLKALLKLQTR